MKCSLKIHSNYGFDHNWTLVINGKSFYLGQDVKFCTRVLEMSPSEVIEESGVKDLRPEENKTKLATWIAGKLGLTEETTENLEPWELSVV